MNHIKLIGALALGLLAGYMAAIWMSGRDSESQPSDWLARADGEYLTQGEFEFEMRQRAGMRPGQFHSLEQKQALLDELLYRRALVLRAREAGFDRLPEVRRSLDQILVNQVLQRDLRPRQETADIAQAEIEAFHAEHADEYRIPARRRVAMLFLALDEQADESTRAEVLARVVELREQALALPENVRDFGLLARDNSEHQASRYRGGVLGWVGDDDPARYSHPQIVIQTAQQLATAGEISEPISDKNGIYLVRLVDYQQQSVRSLDELSDGIRQRLLRDRFVNEERDFRAETLAQAGFEIRPGALDSIEPPGPPARGSDDRRPPAMPGTAAGGN